MVLMILANIYRALTVCQKGKKFFEGCNILLQMWIVEHLYQHPMVARFFLERVDHIKDYEERMEKYKCPEGVSDWNKLFRSLTAVKITWNLPWRQVITDSLFGLFCYRWVLEVFTICVIAGSTSARKTVNNSHHRKYERVCLKSYQRFPLQRV